MEIGSIWKVSGSSYCTLNSEEMQLDVHLLKTILTVPWERDWIGADKIGQRSEVVLAKIYCEGTRSWANVQVM